MIYPVFTVSRQPKMPTTSSEAWGVYKGILEGSCGGYVLAQKYVWYFMAQQAVSLVTATRPGQMQSEKPDALYIPGGGGT